MKVSIKVGEIEIACNVEFSADIISEVGRIHHIDAAKEVAEVSRGLLIEFLNTNDFLEKYTAAIRGQV